MRALLASLMIPLSGLMQPEVKLAPVRRWAPVSSVQTKRATGPRFPITILPEGYVAYDVSSCFNLRFRYKEKFGVYDLPSVGNFSFGLGMRFVY